MDHADKGAGEVADDINIDKVIADLVEVIEGNGDLNGLLSEPVITSVGDNPPPALRYLRETHETFYEGVKATLDSIPR